MAIQHGKTTSSLTTANTALRYVNVPLERRQPLVGHEATDTNNADYRLRDRQKTFAIATPLDDMTLLSFGLDCPSYIARSTPAGAVPRRALPTETQQRRRAVRPAPSRMTAPKPADYV
jgi:hypothetical protein